MPSPDARYGTHCQSSERITLRCDLGASGVFDVAWDRHCVVPMVRACARIKAYNVDNPSKVYHVVSGQFETYNCRHIKGGSTWSNHAWPLAVDINPPQNPYGTWNGDMPQYFKDAFGAEGFIWLPDVGVPDPMHFEHPTWDGRTSPTSWDYHDFLEDDFMGRYTDAELDVLDSLLGTNANTAKLTKDGAAGLRNIAIGGESQLDGSEPSSGDGDWRKAGHSVIRLREHGSELDNFTKGLKAEATGVKGEYNDAGRAAMKAGSTP